MRNAEIYVRIYVRAGLVPARFAGYVPGLSRSDKKTCIANQTRLSPMNLREEKPFRLGLAGLLSAALLVFLGG